MEGFLDTVGAMTLIILAIIGLIAGWIAARLAGRNTVAYMALGVAGAVLLPFVLAALGVTILATGGLLAIIAVALLGAIILLVLGKLIFR